MIIYIFAITCSFFLSMGTIIAPSISLSLFFVILIIFSLVILLVRAWLLFLFTRQFTAGICFFSCL